MTYKRLLLTGAALLLPFLFPPDKAMAEVTLTEDSEAARSLGLPIYRWQDPDVGHRGTIIGVHGLTFYSRSFDDLASFLASEGYTFYAIDMRGFGKWRDQGESYGGDRLVHFDSTRNDFLRLMQFVRHRDPDSKLIGLGESLGSNVILRIAAEQPKLLDGLILSSPGYKMRKQFRLRSFYDVVRCTLYPHKPMDWTPYVKPVLTGDKDVLKRVLADERLNRNLSIADVIKSNLENKRAIRIARTLPSTFPLLVLGGGEDKMFKTSKLPKMLKEINNENSQFWTVNSGNHLILEHQPVKPCMAKILTNWLDKQTAGRSQVAKRTTPPSAEPDLML